RDPSASANRMHGKLFVTTEDGDEHYCSGTAIQSDNQSVVFTAAHCLYQEEFDGWYESAMFVPAYLSGDAPFGKWVADEGFVPNDWFRYETPRVDLGALVMKSNEDTTLVDAVGGMRARFGQSRDQEFEAFGYPGAEPFDGQRLYVCEAPRYYDDPRAPGDGPDPLGIGCDMTPGASGGAWVIDGRYVNSVTSYSFDGLANVLLGPYFGDTAQELFGAAESEVVDEDGPEQVEPTPRPAASASPERSARVSDPDDSPGMLDISEVSLVTESGTLTVRLRTHDAWSKKVLGRSTNFFRIDLDISGGPRPDVYLVLDRVDDRPVATAYAYQRGPDRVVAGGLLSRPQRTEVIAKFSEGVLAGSTHVRWYLLSQFRGKERCQQTCWDFAPEGTPAAL
ncbi:MAG TPA: hypothetical protein VNP73_04565, partial [Actinomycetota bacterium]|nr:hypothetical protein [Actinomycetota bacterium]